MDNRIVWYREFLAILLDSVEYYTIKNIFSVWAVWRAFCLKSNCPLAFLPLRENKSELNFHYTNIMMQNMVCCGCADMIHCVFLFWNHGGMLNMPEYKHGKLSQHLLLIPASWKVIMMMNIFVDEADTLV